MRIRKRPPAAVEAARAAPAVNDKLSSIPGVQNGELVERITSGSVNQVSRDASQGVFVLLDASAEVPTERLQHQTSRHGEEEEQAENNGSGELLMKSLLVVFERTGNRGLTARELVAKLLEYDLPGLQERGHERSSVQVTKLFRALPGFVHIDDGKYFIYHATPHAVAAEASTQSKSSQHQHGSPPPPREDFSGNSPSFSSVRRFKRGAGSISATIKDRAPSDGSKDKISDLSNISIDLPLAESKVEFKKRRRRPPSSQHELAIGPRQCKRYDGRGWQCTRETEEGFSFCEHHQALMNKRTLRLNLAKMRRKGLVEKDDVVLTLEADQPQGKAGVEGSSENSNQGMEKFDDVENLEHYQRRRLVKARSLKSIK